MSEAAPPPDFSAFSHTVPVTGFMPQITVQQCRLVRIEGPGRVVELRLETEETLVGSSAECQMSIPDPTVSRKHFAILNQEGKFLLKDLGSTNGTYVDDVRVREAYLNPGAVIRAGDVRLRFELAYATAEFSPSSQDRFGALLGTSPRMRQIFAALEKVAPSHATLLLQGDTGSGKGAMARAIHEASNRRLGPFIVFDCGATAATLVESELFGHEKGAFTGAVAQRRGALESAQGGTLFIDELTELSLNLQPKLLRALEDREFTRVGSTKSMKLDCRIIAAAQKDLWAEVLGERFRRDLYYRLAVVTIPLPSLRDRREDIPLLVDRFLGELAEGGATTYAQLSAEVRQKLASYDWPGNVRELRNVVERLCIMGSVEGGITADALPLSADRPMAQPVSIPEGSADLAQEADYELPFKDAKERLLNAFEREYIRRLLQKSDANITQAARMAGLGRKHLYTLLAKHGLSSGTGEEPEGG